MEKVSVNIIRLTCHQLKIVSATIVTCLFLILFLPILLIFAVHYALAVLLASKFRPDLSVVDGPSAWFTTEPVYSHPYSTIIWNLICEGSISVEELRRKFKERVLEYREPEGGLPYHRLCCRWTRFLGYSFWNSEKNFDICHHVRLYDYNDEPGMSLNSFPHSPLCTEEALVGGMGKLFSKAFKADTSPWELLLIPNYKSNDDEDVIEEPRKPKCVLCLRIHHILADGVSILGLINRLFDKPTPSAIPKPLATKKSLEKIGGELVSLSLLPYTLARSTVEGTDGSHAWHPQRKQLSGDNVTFYSERIPWQHFRAIMKKHNVGSNAAAFAVSAGAILRLMQEAGHGAPRRSLATVYAYPKANHPGGLVNHTSATYYRFNPEVHVGARLVRHIGNQVGRVKEGNRTADMIGRFQRVSDLFPVWFWNLIAKRPASPTFLFSNLVGPQERLVTGGLELIDIIACVGHDPATGIFCGMTSLLGKLRIVLNVDRSILGGRKIPTDFSRHVVEAIRELLDESPPDNAGCEKDNCWEV